MLFQSKRHLMHFINQSTNQFRKKNGIMGVDKCQITIMKRLQTSPRELTRSKLAGLLCL